MGFTQRFGLTFFGGGEEGSFHEDGGKYTARDRRTMDRLFAALEAHDHGGGPRLEDPEDLDVDLALGSGQLPSGRQFFYRVSYVDAFGLETAAGPERSISTPAPIGIPSPPRVEAETGGDLMQGVHWYALTSHQGSSETPMSAPQVINLTNWRTVRIEAPNGLPAGSDAVSIWRQDPLTSFFTRIATVAVSDPNDPPDPLFTDDGSIASDPCACEPENMPPNENLAGAAASAEITIPAEDVEEGTLVARWRIYRSTASGVYSGYNLLAEVVETVDEMSDELVNTFVDDGTIPLMAGRPLEVSQTLIPSQAIAASRVLEASVHEEAYTLTLGDAGTVVEMDDDDPVTVTVPEEASEEFPLGAVIEILQLGTGTVTIDPEAGVTLLSPYGETGARELAGQYAAASLRYRGDDEWVLNGQLTEV